MAFPTAGLMLWGGVLVLQMLVALLAFVSSLLAKLGVPTRSALIARYPTPLPETRAPTAASSSMAP